MKEYSIFSEKDVEEVGELFASTSEARKEAISSSNVWTNLANVLDARKGFLDIQKEEENLRKNMSELWIIALTNVQRTYNVEELDPNGKGLNLIHKYTGINPVRFNKFVKNTTDRNFVPTEEEYNVVKFLLQPNNRLEDYKSIKSSAQPNIELEGLKSVDIASIPNIELEDLDGINSISIPKIDD